ncbi:MAG: dihydropteroate synthase [Thiomicrorhabdus chilensis]|uniref:dihydropteroate synthase n=1 Tax=Thiomicrorhabdus chilensis TaxID=63656 RepID=UPI00299EB596|nr:dihydropteroate synthase [Thiomicrorhabdus chilensis]MDX1346855.1 dihydropteroate synthase [Thiomicrorhabdus chilensis]
MNKLQALMLAQAGQQVPVPLVMGILNVTPDSFSDGGRLQTRDAVIHQVREMVKAGVDIIDIGGESTRPGALPVSLDEELSRVLPAIDWVRSESDVAISVDTYKPEVMSAAIAQNVDLINDVNALQCPGSLEVVANSDVSVCLMHKQGEPRTMQENPVYEEGVVPSVLTFLQHRVAACKTVGMTEDRIILDPGFGFGKSLKDNVGLFHQLEQIVALSYPTLVGVSRKGMIGSLAGDVSVEQRMVGSVAAAIVAAKKGASILRVHDVLETRQALLVAQNLWGKDG